MKSYVKSHRKSCTEVVSNQDHRDLWETYVDKMNPMINWLCDSDYQALRESFHKSFFLMLSSTRSARPLIETSIRIIPIQCESDEGIRTYMIDVQDQNMIHSLLVNLLRLLSLYMLNIIIQSKSIFSNEYFTTSLGEKPNFTVE